MVTHENADHGFDDVTLHHVGVNEAFAHFGALRRHIRGEHLHEFGGVAQGIYHLVFGKARVHTHALNRHDGRGGIKVFRLKRSRLAAVKGVGVGSAELSNVKVHGPLGDFFVRGKADAKLGVRDFGVIGDVLGHGHDSGNAGLVICPQKRSAVRKDNVFALVFRNFRKVFHGKDDVFFSVKKNVITCKAQDLGLYVRAACVRRRIHMRNKPHGRALFTALCCGNRCVNNAAFADSGISDSEVLKFPDEFFGENKFFGRRRFRVAFSHGLGVIADVL